MDILCTIRIDASGMGRGFNQRLKQVSVIIVVAALQQSTNAFQTHPSINRRFWQIGLTAIFIALVLHKHEVPNLNKAVTVLFRTARRATPDVIAMIIKNFRTRPTGARSTHRPKIIVRGDTDDTVIRQARMFFPDIHRLLVGVINRDQQLVGINAKFFGD